MKSFPKRQVITVLRSLRIYESSSFDPYENLAIEKLLLDTTPEDACTLYLWQNQNTVVIGYNQNPWAECRTGLLEQEGGKLARRLSGGGAVFHDLGNLNFTFLTSKDNYDLDKQLSVIQAACRSFGIDAQRSGRNDILVDGQKFSGNAFYHSQGQAYHHGTLLINVDMDKLSRYLSPPKAKLEAKGVSSVRSRVINLQSLCSELTCTGMKTAMNHAFEEVYGLSAQPVHFSEADRALIAQTKEQISQWEYLFGKPLPFTFECQGHFPWGHIQLQLRSGGGQITGARVFSDAMDWQLSHKIENALTGCKVHLDNMTKALHDSLPSQIANDLSQLLKEQNL